MKKLIVSCCAAVAFGVAFAEDVTIPSGDVAALVTAIQNISKYENILLSPGTYDLKDAKMAQQSQLDFTSGGGHAIIGLGADPSKTVLQGGGEGSDRRVISLAPTAVISNLTVTGGHFTTNDRNGGGVNSGTAIGCIIKGNVATKDGGGCYVTKLYGCTVADNTAGQGGGAYKGTEIADTTFSGNTAKNGWAEAGGGAIYSDANILVRGCTFTNNTSAFAGGIQVRGGAGVVATVTNCTFVGNTCTYYGAGIYCKSGDANVKAKVLVTDCVFHHNTLSQQKNTSYGGVGVDIGTPDSLISKCHFLTNTSASCGGGAGRGRYVDCTFVGNTAQSHGGGLWGATSATGCTFVDNEAGVGGGAYGGNLALTNCVFLGNYATVAYEQDGGGAVNFGGGESVLCGCSLTNNSAVGYYPTVRVDGSGTCFITNTTIVGSYGLYGGVIGQYKESTKTIRVVDCDFIANSNVTCIAIREGQGEVVGSRFTGNVMNNSGPASSSKIPLIGCAFTNNISRKEYGGAVAYATVVSNCTFSGNIVCAEARDGAAAYAPRVVYGSTFVGNVASNGCGGALYLGDDCTGVYDSTFKGNQARGWRYGGDICSKRSATDLPVVSNCTFLGGSYCGASRGHSIHGVNAIRCTITGQASNTGWAIANSNMRECFITNNTAAGTEAFDGWHDELKQQNNYDYHDINCVFADNVVSNAAGNASTPLCWNKTLVNCTFANNWRKDATGGGIINSSNCKAINTLFVNNRRKNGCMDVTGKSLVATNCVFTALEYPLDQNPKAVGCRLCTVDQAGLGVGDRPYALQRRSRARDRAYVDDTIRTLVGACDIYGGPRFIGNLDIGAAECDLPAPGLGVVVR